MVPSATPPHLDSAGAWHTMILRGRIHVHIVHADGVLGHHPEILPFMISWLMGELRMEVPTSAWAPWTMENHLHLLSPAGVVPTGLAQAQLAAIVHELLVGIALFVVGSEYDPTGHKTMPYRWQVKGCRKKFSVKTGTVMEWSKVSYQE